MNMDRLTSSQYPNSGYQSAYPQYPQNYGSGYNYQGYGQYPGQTVQPTPPGEGPVTSTSEWGSTRYPSTPKDAVAQEMQQQKAQLTKQREDYVRKASVLRHELEQLRIQKQELVGNDRSPDRGLSNILRQNDKLQEEIQGKMKAIHNVIEMLSSIIKDGQSIADLEASLLKAEAPEPSPPTVQSHSHSQSSSHSHHSNSHHSRSESAAQVRKKSKTPEPPADPVERFCYVHYDTGLHWCRSCDEFPETAKDFLLHLQDKKHKESMKENDLDSTPWHKIPAEPVLPSFDDAPKKRIPIKGLQFFIAAPSWYCKLCDVWIGDLHCASHHLKSQAHFQNYENFVVQNPQWEMDWLKDREKSMTRKGEQDSSDSDSAKKKRKQRKEKRQTLEAFHLKEKKKKKKTKKKRRHSSDSSSSSSSSDSSSDDDNEDRSKSIRVAMRNMKQVQSIMEEDLSAKWSVLEKLVDEHKKKEQRDKRESEQPMVPPPPVMEDPLINQWMTVSQPPAKERQMLEELKERMRQKQEQERIKQAEMDQKRKDKEREEAERSERRKREEKLAAEAADRRKREQEEAERIREKERSQVRFKTNYRRRRSPSRSGDEGEGRAEKYHRQESRQDSRQESRHESRQENRQESSRQRKDSESRPSHKSQDSRSRSRSRSTERSSERKQEENNVKNKKPPGPPSYKKLPFIGRMPLFKNKGKAPEDREDTKEIKKQSYDQPRRTRFEPGNLPRAFMPNPEVVCFPKLSSIPPLNFPPPPPPAVSQPIMAPEPPKISYIVEKTDKSPKAPPPPKFESQPEKPVNLSDDEVLYGTEGVDPSMMGQYYQDYGSMMYQQSNMYQYEAEDPIPPPPPPHPHGMPLEPPPLPPDDDLAMLGICADDMAAQSF